MNRAIPDEIVEEIRSRSDIVDIIGSYIPLKKAGASWKACCPFHQEKTPSFVITPQRQRFHCFGCGKGGDVFRFVMEHEGIDFPNAIHMLASRCGVIIPERTFSSPQDAAVAQEIRSRKERLYELHEKLAVFFAANLWDHPESTVAQYFQTRQIPVEDARKFGIGAAPDGWEATLSWGRQQGFSVDEMLDAGVIVPSEKNPERFYDRFRNRLVFPIWNEQGRVVAFSARTVLSGEADGAKYVNSPETPIFKKSNVLYALSLARQSISQKGFVILCEGQLDVIAMHRAGFTNAVAPQGTAFTFEQARMLRRYTDKVYLCFDADKAGLKAAVRGLEILLPLEFEVRVITLPGGKDPDELLKTQGADAIAGAVNTADDFFDFLYRRKTAEHDATSPNGKTRIVNDFIVLLQLVSNSVTRSLYVNRLAGHLGINEQALFLELNRFRGKEKYERTAGSGEKAAEPEATETDATPPQIRDAEHHLLLLALANSEVAQQLTHDLPAERLSASPVGHAINEVIRMTMAGDWEHVIPHLNDWEREHPNPELSSILAEAAEFEPSYIRKAVADCLHTITRHYQEQHKAELLQKMRLAVTPEEKQALMQELIALNQVKPQPTQTKPA